MSYDIDEFVNSNRVNVEFRQEAFDSQEELVFDLFKQLVKWDPACRSDDSNDDAYPVIVLERDNVPIAWYDLEMFCGYVQS